MAHKNRDVPDASGSSTGQQQLYTYPPTSTPAASSSPAQPVVPMDTDADQKALGATIFKGPKRKRLVKVRTLVCSNFESRFRPHSFINISCRRAMRVIKANAGVTAQVRVLAASSAFVFVDVVRGA